MKEGGGWQETDSERGKGRDGKRQTVKEGRRGMARDRQ